MRKNLLTLCLLGALTAFAQDTISVLCIGNSFTFFYDSNVRLEELAASQGHALKTNASTVGGYTFRRHLERAETMEAAAQGGYDYVFLQDQSQTPAWLGQSPKEKASLATDAKALADSVRKASPKARIYVEQTWAYPAFEYGGFGSWDHFDFYLRKGTKRMAQKAHAKVSPIGEAFRICRLERPDIELFYPDQKHQSALGTYLKSCVNYLLIYQAPFTPPVSDCGNDPEQAAYLRRVAERVVLKK